jgi:hypothetical protein
LQINRNGIGAFVLIRKSNIELGVGFVFRFNFNLFNNFLANYLFISFSCIQYLKSFFKNEFLIKNKKRLNTFIKFEFLKFSSKSDCSNMGFLKMEFPNIHF